MSGADQVKAAGRTLDLFEALAVARGPLSLTELSSRIGVPISSCHALVRTLQSRGYVYVLDERKRIYPTKRLAALGHAFARHDPVLERVHPILAQLAADTGETAILGKHQGDHVIYLDIIEGKHTIRFNASPGDVRPAHSSAIGKSALSLLSDAELTRAISRLKLARVTDQTITDPAKLQADIVAGRSRGYFVSRGETVTDVMGLSIAQRIGEELYAIGVAGPISRVEEHREAYVQRLKQAGADLQRIDLDLRGAP
jgi:IclR family transcriptional regulator, acetate operon repressor